MCIILFSFIKFIILWEVSVLLHVIFILLIAIGSVVHWFFSAIKSLISHNWITYLWHYICIWGRFGKFYCFVNFWGVLYVRISNISNYSYLLFVHLLLGSSTDSVCTFTWYVPRRICHNIVFVFLCGVVFLVGEGVVKCLCWWQCLIGKESSVDMLVICSVWRYDTIGIICLFCVDTNN